MKKEIRTEWVYITPKLAQKYLDLSKGNRPINTDRVDMYARDMASGRWENCGQGIVIDENGVLKDGHHRLHAIIKSGVTIEMLVIIGVSAGAKNYDIGKSRTTGDIIKYGTGKEYDWVSDRKTIALAKFHNRIILHKTVISPDEILSFITRNSDELQWISENAYRKSSRSLPGTIKWMNKAPFHYALFCAMKNGAPKDKLEQFVEGIKTGQKLTPAMTRFRDELMVSSISNRNQRLQLLLGCENAINDFINGVEARVGGYKIGTPIKPGKEKKAMLQPVYSNNEMLKYA